MIIYPAIDIKDGNCVRLKKGIMEDATIFNNSVLEQAKEFESKGVKNLHIVDLNGAFEGRAVNKNEVELVIKNTKLSVQLGGGIRTLEDIKNWLDLGLQKVILGTVAVKTPDIVHKACELYPNRIILGIDAKDGLVATEGWADVSSVKAIDIIKQFENCKIDSIIYTDIAKDGMMQGPSFDSIKEMAESSPFDIIASGGVSSQEDIDKLTEINKSLKSGNIKGAIVGRAIYEGKIKPAS